MLFFRLLFLLLLFSIDHAFDAGFLEMGSNSRKDKDTTHYGITVCSLCRVTLDYLKTVYQIDVSFLDVKFNQTNGQCQGNVVNDLINIMTSAQGRGVNPWQFSTTIKTIASSNTKTDLKEVFKEESHFDGETFFRGSQLVMKRYRVAVNSITQTDNYDQAQKAFGEMLHTLQDFYSHTNFIELENSSPTDVLGQRTFRDNEYASKKTKTCVSCRGTQCQTESNLDQNLQQKKLLTSGYFIPLGAGLLGKKKPKGKCSHGGKLDGSALDEPIGGINKDTLSSVHGHLHYRAGYMAYRASVQILNQFWREIGNDAFGSFLTLKKKLNSLVISIDIECSIADYVELAKQTSISIVNQYQGNEYAPHNYVLIAFDSEKARSIINTRRAEDLITAIESLNSCQKLNNTDGQMYYHALIEGLKRCEYASIIYTFTDSSAKDAHLKYQARALLRSKKAVIYSLLGQKTKVRLLKSRVNVIDPLNGSDNDTDLASISGGLTYPMIDDDRPVISQFILRRLEWTRLQSLVILKAKSTSLVFYVDSSIEELYLDLSSMTEINDITQVQLRGPNKEVYLLDDDSISTKNLYMWKKSRPDPGAWNIQFGGFSGKFVYDIQIQGKTSILCSSTLHKEMDPDADTSGFTQLTTEPLINSNLRVLTWCENLPPSNVMVSLIDRSGLVIANYSSIESNQLGTITEIRVPREQFRLQTIISLPNGTKIQRVEKQLISPTILSIELINQPFIVAVGETISMNYTIKSATSQPINVHLQIMDTLKLLANETIEKDFSFVNQTSGTETLTLPANYPREQLTDLVTFSVSIQDQQTVISSYENDETVSVYLEFNTASLCTGISFWLISLSIFITRFFLIK